MRDPSRGTSGRAQVALLQGACAARYASGYGDHSGKRIPHPPGMAKPGMLIIRRALLLVGGIALFVALLISPAPWEPARTLKGTVVSSDFGRAGRWTKGSTGLLTVRLADGTIVTSTIDALELPSPGDSIALRQLVGVFGQTLDLTPIPQESAVVD